MVARYHLYAVDTYPYAGGQFIQPLGSLIVLGLYAALSNVTSYQNSVSGTVCDLRDYLFGI